MKQDDFADLLLAIAVIVVLLLPSMCSTGFNRMGVMP